jgi:hypothetical protein
LQRCNGDGCIELVMLLWLLADQSLWSLGGTVDESMVG